MVTRFRWVDDCCPCCGVSKYNWFEVIRGVDGKKNGPIGDWNFCPGCGLDMRVKVDIVNGWLIYFDGLDWVADDECGNIKYFGTKDTAIEFAKGDK